MNINELRRSKRRPLENAKDFFFYFFFSMSAETQAACCRCQESVQAALIVNARLKAARKVLSNVEENSGDAPEQTICDTPSLKPPFAPAFIWFKFFPWRHPTRSTKSRGFFLCLRRAGITASNGLELKAATTPRGSISSAAEDQSSFLTRRPGPSRTPPPWCS